MRISIVTPAPERSRAGNRVTALRWARLLTGLGHRVRVDVAYADEEADLMVALHAWRSAASIARFRERHPERPLVVALTGTDIYHFLETDPKPTLRSLALADALVGLHDLARDAVPPEHHHKLSVIHQSVSPIATPAPPLRRCFETLVVGHLRAEKDPLRAAAAARLLPATSRIRVTHLGGATDADWAERARTEMAANPRYVWRGEAPGGLVRRLLSRGRLMVLSSLQEGGANVISEAVVAGIPVVASRIPGTVGLLDEDYPGYFPTGDTAALAALMRRAEEEPRFLQALAEHCAARAPLFAPKRERDSWRALIARLAPGAA